MRDRHGRKKEKTEAGMLWFPVLLGVVCAAAMCMLAVSLTQMISGGLGDLPVIIGSGIYNEWQSGEGRDELSNGQNGGVGENEYPRPLICIDAGHGYDDPGAMHANLNGLDEADINLEIALILAELMEAKGYGVLLTRESDEIPEGMKRDERGLYVLDPYERCDISNEAEVDLFISIHCNSLPSNSSVSGAQLYYTEGHTEDNPEYVETLADSMEMVFGERPKVVANPENDSYVVNRLVDAPSVLVETGFITNAADAKRMLSADWRQQMAEALAEGIGSFLEPGNG